MTAVQFDKTAYLDKAEEYARENGGDVLTGADWQPPKETFGISHPKPRIKNAKDGDVVNYTQGQALRLLSSPQPARRNGA